MTLYEWFTLILSVLSAVVLPLMLLAFRSIAAMRANEILHLQESLDRVERKIDEHLRDHARPAAW